MGCRKKCGSDGKSALTEEQNKILAALAKVREPCACKDIAEATGMTSNSVSCRLRSLKNKGYVDSPLRCKYSITEDGKTAASA